MNKQSQEFVKKLGLLDPFDEPEILETRLYELTDALKDIEYPQDIISAMFQFFESYPDAEHGSPGPFVHFIERYYPDYVGELLVSIRRTPTFHTIWMLNRILNTPVSENERISYLQVLQSVAERPDADARARQYARQFYTQQIS